VLAVAPDPERGRRLSEARIVSVLRKGGRQRNLEPRARGIQAALRAPQLEAPPLVVEAQAVNTSALVAVITTLNEQITRLEAELVTAFDRHPDAEILRSLPGLGDILGARVLAEFADAPDRYVDASVSCR
jgi:transposase